MYLGLSINNNNNSSNIQSPIQNAKKGIFFKVPAFSFLWNCLEVSKIDFFSKYFILEKRARGKKRSGVNFFSHAFTSNIQPPMKNAKKGIIFKVAAFLFLWNCLEVDKIDSFPMFLT